MIIKELFSNIAILVSILFLYSQVTNNSPLGKDSSFSKKMLVGLLGGFLGCVLMQYSIRIDTTIVDLRHIPIILLSFYGGAIPSIVAMGIVIIGRFLIGVNISAFASVFLIVPITIVSLFVSKSNLTKYVKIFLILTFSNLIFSIIVSFLIKDISLLVKLIPVYWITSYLAGYTAFYIIELLRNSQLLFSRYKMESTTDGLTGLYNVRKFDEVFNGIIKELENKNEKLSLLYIDIDHFKKINDTYGHSEGDQVLRELSTILKNSTRSFDVVSRNGGEEFTAILLDCPLDRAKEISERIRGNVEKHFFTLSTGEKINVTVSIGLACYHDTTMNVSDLIDDADQALYHAKRTGRNKVCITKM